MAETVTLLELLKKGLFDLKLDLPNDAMNALISYLNLLGKWNKTYNLTAVTDPNAMITQHLLDSLSINTYLQGHHIIDVGTGAGLPGIPLAIANPDKQFALLDSLSKRTQFLQQVIYELKLRNVTVIDARAENYKPEIKYDQIITRAFASLKVMLQATEHLASKTAQFLAMKGANFAEELEEISDTYTIMGIHRLSVPGLEAERHLIILERCHSG